MLTAVLWLVLGITTALVAIILACVIHWAISTRLSDLYDQDE